MSRPIYRPIHLLGGCLLHLLLHSEDGGLTSRRNTRSHVAEDRSFKLQIELMTVLRLQRSCYIFNHEVGAIAFFQNVGEFLPNYTASHLRGRYPSTLNVVNSEFEVLTTVLLCLKTERTRPCVLPKRRRTLPDYATSHLRVQ
jgi:hypothetical protein